MMLTKLRKSSHLSQDDLALLSGVSREYISKLESGRRRPSPDVAKRIARVFGLTIDEMWELFYLRRGEGEREG